MTRPSRRRHAAAVCVAAALLLSACGDDDATETDGGDTTEAGAATEDMTEAEDDMAEDDMAEDDMTEAEDDMADDDMADDMATTTVGIVETPFGPALGGPDGRVLYRWDEEPAGTITCVDDCAVKWPPLLADEITVAEDLEASRFSLLERPDGSMQVALDGQALYHMEADEPGDALCQGLDGWFIVNPDLTVNRATSPE